MSFLKQDYSSQSRKALVVIILLMFLVYFLPIWVINMGGVQFTEPLKIYIWAHKITGGTDVDLYNINDFNHYIGMKKIDSKSIPELNYMPYILAYMILGALVTFFYKKMYLLLLGLCNLILVGLAGFYDFWIWLHDYGTNLDTRAPLYDKNVDFQPPLIGCKGILNIETCSWPHLGGIFLFTSLFLLGSLIFYEYKKYKKHN